MKLGEFLIDLVVDAGKGELTVNRLVSSFGQLEVSAVGNVIGIQQLASKLLELNEIGVKLSIGLNRVGMSSDVNKQKLQQWSHAANLMGFEAEAVASGIMQLQGEIGKFRLGHENMLFPLMEKGMFPGFDAAGKDAFQILTELNDHPFWNLGTKDERKTKLDRIGFPDELRMMMESRDLGKQLKTASGFSILSDKDIHKFHEIHQKMVEISGQITAVAMDMASWNAEAFLKTLGQVEEAIRKIRKVANIGHDVGFWDTIPKAFESMLKGDPKGLQEMFRKGDVFNEKLYKQYGGQVPKTPELSMPYFKGMTKDVLETMYSQMGHKMFDFYLTAGGVGGFRGIKDLVETMMSSMSLKTMNLPAPNMDVRLGDMHFKAILQIDNKDIPLRTKFTQEKDVADKMMMGTQ